MRFSGASRNVLAVPVLLLALGLGGCSEARRAVGWDKAPPDEFKILTRAPLAMPPDYGLRPPTPGAPRPQEGSTTDQARTAITGGRPGARAGAGAAAGAGAVAGRASAGEAALLEKSGADRADPAIRQTVDREARAVADADRSFTDRLIFWREPEPPGTVIDAEREQQRLRENQALGRAANAGDTPIVRRRQRGLLEGLF
ncbi:MAG: DUF3035 domain-containing protein [Alphaproteobacteria bacterium]|nr:DUF3035 domain-containing protein [Alphaproteobacteria bacterium]